MASSINTILEELYSLQRLGIKVGLEHTVQLLDQIGNPHKNLRLIHKVLKRIFFLSILED